MREAHLRSPGESGGLSNEILFIQSLQGQEFLLQTPLFWIEQIDIIRASPGQRLIVGRMPGFSQPASMDPANFEEFG